MAEQYQQAGELKDRVVHINRVTKVVKGGKNFSFAALVVVGEARDLLWSLGAVFRQMADARHAQPLASRPSSRVDAGRAVV